MSATDWIAMTRRPLLPSLAALGPRVIRGAGRLLSAWRNRRGLAMLAQFDERALHDIGLSRSDIGDALSRHWWDDPTEILNARRGARRASRTGHGFVAPPLVPADDAFTRPPTDRPSRYTV